MTRVLQLVPLPVPAGYRAPVDLPIQEAFNSPDLDQWLRERGAEVSAVVTDSLRGMPADLWSRLPSLELIANFGAGLDRIDLSLAAGRGVRVTYTPDLLKHDVADLAMALLLSILRRVREADEFVRRSQWGKEPFGPGRSTAGLRLGILGMGRIGRAIERRGDAFGMQIGYHSRHHTSDRLTWFSSALDLAKWADVLVAALPGGTETHHLVDLQVLHALGPDGIFINVARGSVVDEAALVEALRSGRIAGAGLDVFAMQPSNGAQFAGLSNVILTPHIGSFTTQTRFAMADSVYGNVRAFL